jgi:hypothetical protein
MLIVASHVLIMDLSHEFVLIYVVLIYAIILSLSYVSTSISVETSDVT